ncbi:lipoprotein [Spiroplasma melliferum]|uniref:Uncharacterized protein n=2 Tax=Spiroplasma melliferum TaxID=2134 RepID=A0AAI9T3T8_SPIME|nr:lipoprotein [Spiroplasma melliferum]KAI92983.1 hypothetical protein SPM_003145 [Spiroplasma melliferum KC3]QCO23841.1 putative lipoprotein [Spiroplasma melliferum]
MKKLLSILGAIGLTATSTTNLISCYDDKLAEKPPENNNWKLVSSILGEGNTKKWYIGIFKKDNKWNIIKWNGNKEFYSYYYDKVYFWNGSAEPTETQIPTINPKTGKITDWKD